MKKKIDEPVIEYAEGVLQRSIEMLIYIRTGEDPSKSQTIKKLAEELIRLPQMTAGEVVRLLAEKRNIELNEETIKDIVSRIEEEVRQEEWRRISREGEKE